MTTNSRTALVHEWLTDWGGSENVLAAISRCFDRPDIFALVDFLPDEARALLNHGTLTTTLIQSLPFARSHFWYYLGLMPLAIEALDLRDYELIVSSSHAVAKGALTSAEQMHISYVHSPMRYAWDLHHEYLADYGLDRGARGWLARWIFHRLRNWDRQTANNVDLFLANSENVARRIWKTYRRKAMVLYPPVDTSRFSPAPTRGDHFVSVSRLVSYKRVDLIVDAFRQMPDKRLLVIGDGPELARLKSLASRNIEFMGYQPDHVVAGELSRARALVFAANEDFGITPVEAQAAGTPVIAFGQGGALETIRDARRLERGTGILFPEQSAAAIIAVLRENERVLDSISPNDCRHHAAQFSAEIFRRRFENLLQVATAAWTHTRRTPANFELEVLNNV